MSHFPRAPKQYNISPIIIPCAEQSFEQKYLKQFQITNIIRKQKLDLEKEVEALKKENEALKRKNNKSLRAQKSMLNTINCLYQ